MHKVQPRWEQFLTIRLTVQRVSGVRVHHRTVRFQSATISDSEADVDRGVGRKLEAELPAGQYGNLFLAHLGGRVELVDLQRGQVLQPTVGAQRSATVSWIADACCNKR